MKKLKLSLLLVGFFSLLTFSSVLANCWYHPLYGWECEDDTFLSPTPKTSHTRPDSVDDYDETYKKPTHHHCKHDQIQDNIEIIVQ